MPIAQPGLKRKPNRGSTLRVRSPEHRKWIRKQVCAACGRSAEYTNPIEAAHVRMNHAGAMAIKPGDELTVPLHKTCHRLQGAIGERIFWNSFNVHDPSALALSYARRSPDPLVREAAQ